MAHHGITSKRNSLGHGAARGYRCALAVVRWAAGLAMLWIGGDLSGQAKAAFDLHPEALHPLGIHPGTMAPGPWCTPGPSQEAAIQPATADANGQRDLLECSGHRGPAVADEARSATGGSGALWTAVAALTSAEVVLFAGHASGSAAVAEPLRNIAASDSGQGTSVSALGCGTASAGGRSHPRPPLHALPRFAQVASLPTATVAAPRLDRAAFPALMRHSFHGRSSEFDEQRAAAITTTAIAFHPATARTWGFFVFQPHHPTALRHGQGGRSTST